MLGCLTFENKWKIGAGRSSEYDEYSGISYFNTFNELIAKTCFWIRSDER